MAGDIGGAANASLGRLARGAAGIALLCGTLDLAFVRVYWSHAGTTLEAIGQSIGAGWFGAASQRMGWHSAGAGLLSHYAIMFAMALAWFASARAWPWLRRRPVVYGALYGALLYVVMTEVVVPLSAAPVRPPQPAWMLASIAAHVLLVGIPIAVAARRLLGPARSI
jgi:hypothetical protein